MTQKLPYPDEVARRAEYEVDEVLASAPPELYKHLDVPTRQLLRGLMIASFERGAGWLAQEALRIIHK